MRKKFLTPVFVLLFLLSAPTLFAQSKPTPKQTIRKTNPGCANNFPQCFIGNWKGKLQWIVAGKPTKEFTMQLKVHPADSAGNYTWQIIYGDEGTDNRPYLLKPVDTASGHWIIDELDGIILDSYVHGNSIHGAFTVQGNTIIDNYKIENGKLLVEFFTVKLSEKNISGKGTAEVPTVESYKIAGYQTGVLTKVK